MDIILQRFIQNIREMRAFGAIAIGVAAFVMHFFHRLGKELFRISDTLRYYRQIRQFKRGSVLLHNRHQVDAMEEEIILFHLKSFLREDKGLVYEVVIVILQWLALLFDSKGLRSKSQFMLGKKISAIMQRALPPPYVSMVRMSE